MLNRTGAGGYEQTREQLAAGVIVPGLRKLGGSWLVPVTALAEALDGLTDTDAAGQATPSHCQPGTRSPVPTPSCRGAGS